MNESFITYQGEQYYLINIYLRIIYGKNKQQNINLLNLHKISFIFFIRCIKNVVFFIIIYL